jgi:hypothetical protein
MTAKPVRYRHPTVASSKIPGSADFNARRRGGEPDYRRGVRPPGDGS